MDNITRNVNSLNRFFSNLNAQNMKLVRPAFDAYLNKASDLHEEFGELLKEHGSKILGCDEKCIDDCLDPDFVSFWEIPMCIKHCKCKRGVISINKSGGEFGSIFDEIYGTSGDEDEEFLGTPKVSHRGCHGHFGKKKEFNLPELMKYSNYDKDAWSFFKRYQDDI
jgi:hypothetical protein